MKFKNRLNTALLAIIMIGALIMQTGCGSGEPSQNPQATIEMTDGKKIVIELLPEFAPNTVSNFIAVANRGEYEGTIFHRIIPGLIIQGGGIIMDETLPNGFEQRDTGYSIAAEVINNGFDQNTLKHERGVISMARTSEYDTASNQFFIMAGSEPGWDGEYAGFGRVIEGIEVVDGIIAFAVANGMDDPATIKSVTIDSFGYDWPEPEVIADAE